MHLRPYLSDDCSIVHRTNESNGLHELLVSARSPESLRGNMIVIRSLGYTPLGAPVAQNRLSGYEFTAAAVADRNYLADWIDL